MIIFYKHGWNIYTGVTIIMSVDMSDDENVTSLEFDEENSLECDMSGEENGLDFDMSNEENQNLGENHVLSSKPH